VAVQSDTQLVSFQGWTLRVRPAPQRPARLLVMVHGWTGDENSMWVFTRNLGPQHWIVAPRAPYPARPSGYSWRRGPGHGWPTLVDLEPAVGSLLALIDAYAADNGLDAAQFDAVGFSQGAALVAALTLLQPARVGRAGVLAGFIPEGAEALARSRPLGGKPFFVAHGTRDPRVPVEHAHTTVRLLEEAGAQVTYCEDDVAHKLGLKCLRALESFFG
jgi:phospholipase/carboxylesterase